MKLPFGKRRIQSESKTHFQSVNRRSNEQTATCEQERPPTEAASVPAAKLAGVPIQEAQRLLVELGCALVNRSVSAGLEHQKLATIDSAGQRVGESQRGDLVVATEGDLGRCFNTRELGDSIMGDHRV